jgi:hypothetical protein
MGVLTEFAGAVFFRGKTGKYAILEVSHGRGYLKEGYATINGYYTEMFNEIAFINTGMMVYDTGNISRSFRTGVDTEGKINFLKHAYTSAGYSYLYAFDRSAGTELHPQPNHTVKFRLGLDTGARRSVSAPNAA